MNDLYYLSHARDAIENARIELSSEDRATRKHRVACAKSAVEYLRAAIKWLEELQQEDVP